MLSWPLGAPGTARLCLAARHRPTGRRARTNVINTSAMAGRGTVGARTVQRHGSKAEGGRVWLPIDEERSPGIKRNCRLFFFFWGRGMEGGCLVELSVLFMSSSSKCAQ